MAWFREKEAKETVVVFENVTCYQKLPLILIGKYDMPACFSNQICPLKYAPQKCVWMDRPTCWNWLYEVSYREVRRRTFHPVILFVDNEQGDFEAFQMENVVVRCFTEM